jgi:Tfp pilus assembly protein PilF
MTRAARRNGLVVLALITIVALQWFLVGCEDSKTEQEENSTTTTITSTGSTERVVVGGKTTEEYEAALPGLEAAAKAAPNDPQALQDLAVAQYNTGRRDEAASTYEKLLTIRDDAFTHNNYGNLLRDMQKTAEAKAQYQKAIALDKTYANAYINLATLLTTEGDTNAAVELLSQGASVMTGDDKTRLENYRDRIVAASATTTTT